ncbi:MAG: hypothetical protein P4L53_21620 [Candidatus Obscuribacterales bacterium]|nr:hypothetical protein [Candidatus Obscuribacterales bacterium]
MPQPDSKKIDKLDLCIVAILLGIICCLAGNILGVELAVMQNDQACQRVTLAISKSLDAGDTDTENLTRVAQAAIRECGPETFMVATPSCTFIHDDMKKGDHFLWVGTKIRAKVPAPALMFATGKENKLEFHRTYVFDLNAESESDSDNHSGPNMTNPENGG